MSLIHTCQLCDVNSFEYLTELQRHARELGGESRTVDAVELPRDAGSVWRILKPGWPERIVSGQAEASVKNGWKGPLWQGRLA